MNLSSVSATITIGMKIFFLLLLAGSMLVSCKKESSSSINLIETADSAAVLKLKGDFINGPYGNVAGTAKILLKDSLYQLLLDSSFTSSNGPDLKIYLSKEIQPINFVNLGSLKSINGSQLYNIPAGVDFVQYKYALIHCQQYDHLFGSAELKP